MSDKPSLLARMLAGGHTFGGRTFGGNTFGGGTYGGNAYGASASPPTPPVSIAATPPALPPFQAPGTYAGQMMPPLSAYGQGRPPAPPTPMMVAAAAQPPQPTGPDAPTSIPPLPPSVQIGAALGAQAAPGSMVGRNALERDYYQQLAQNPNGFDQGWLGRLFNR